jgi:hypothetical protein
MSPVPSAPGFHRYLWLSVTLRRLIAPLLLLLPVLGGGARVAFTPAGQPAQSTVVIDRLSVTTSPPFTTLSGGGSIAEVVQTSNGVRAPARLPRHGSDLSCAGARPAAAARSRACSIERTSLGYRRQSLRARTNVPITYGNPPPASLS